MTNTNSIRLIIPEWKKPTYWVDLDEHLLLQQIQDYQARVATLFAMFDDPLVERIETGVFVKGYLQAANGNQAQDLTARQEQAVRLRSEAKRLGRTDIHQFVADRLRIHRANATQLLTRADQRLEAKMIHNDELLAIDNRDVVSPHDEALIQRWLKNNPRECAGYGRPAQPGLKACEGKASHGHSLCWWCTKAYGLYNEWPDWLRFKVNDIKKEHRQAAIEALYHQLDDSLPGQILAKIA